MKKYWLFLGGLWLIAVVAVIGQRLVSAGPKQDQQAVRDLGLLQNAITTYASKNDKLPDALSELTLTDEELEQRLTKYEYRKLSAVKYELCADFKTDASRRYSFDGGAQASHQYGGKRRPVEHNKGRDCFEDEISIYLKNTSSQRTATPLAQPATNGTTTTGTVNPNLSYCGKSSVYIKAVAVKRKLTNVDNGNNKMTLGDANSSLYLSWNALPEVYDANCKLIKLSDLKLGDTVTAYYGDQNMVYAIQKF